MRANDAILLGSPGTDLARSAADFHVDGGQVYVGAASTDPVSWIGVSGGVPNKLNELLGHPFGRYAGLGIDPAGDGFGSIRFKAEAPGGDVLDLRNHSHYYDLGGEALRGMTDTSRVMVMRWRGRVSWRKVGANRASRRRAR